MKIDGKRIAFVIEKEIKRELKKLKKKKLRLATFLISNSSEQLSFVKIKAKVAKNLGIKFELIHYKIIPSFEKLAKKIKDISENQATTGIIIQQPLPTQLSTESIYNYVSLEKEIEGHKHKSQFLPPIGLSVLTILKYIFGTGKIDKNLIVDIKGDRIFFKRILKNKKIVLVGRGITGGRPIGKTLTEAKISYIGINSQTPNPENYYKEADIIISAAGKKIITAEVIKPGVILINVGLRKEFGRLKGDYDEKEIKDIVSFYTPTPGGIGPIDIVYLYKNLVEAVKLQR